MAESGIDSNSVYSILLSVLEEKPMGNLKLLGKILRSKGMKITHFGFTLDDGKFGL